jgi:hypothetical protein
MVQSVSCAKHSTTKAAVHIHLEHVNASLGPLNPAIRPGQGSRDAYMHVMIGEVTRESQYQPS